MTKSQEEIESMTKKLEKELHELPDQDVFGGSNLECKEDLRNWIKDLKDGSPYNIEEVDDWVNGDWSVLGDYE